MAPQRGAPVVLAVHRSSSHSFSKFAEDAITLLPGLGVQGDAHSGATVRHRSRVAQDPRQPNLRQVHLLHAELFDDLMAAGFAVWAGELGENVTTRGIELLALGAGTRLHLGGTAVVEITGLRHPCSQIDRFQPGLMAAVLDRDTDGRLIRKSGVMGVVLVAGQVRAGDSIQIELPAGSPKDLMPV